MGAYCSKSGGSNLDNEIEIAKYVRVAQSKSAYTQTDYALDNTMANKQSTNDNNFNQLTIW